MRSLVRHLTQSKQGVIEPKHKIRINQMMYVHGLDSTVIAAAAPVVGTRWAFVEVLELELDPTPLS